MKDVAESTDLSHMIEKLREIAGHVLTRERMRCSLNATPETMAHALAQTEEFISNLPRPAKTALTHDDLCVQVPWRHTSIWDTSSL